MSLEFIPKKKVAVESWWLNKEFLAAKTPFHFYTSHFRFYGI